MRESSTVSSPRPPAPRTRKRRAGGQLSPETIIEASLRIAARGSEDAFTVRRIGEEIGADPTAIYRHFRDKDELLLAVADHVVGEAIDGVPADLDWKGRLRALAQQSVVVSEKYPVVVVNLVSRTLRRHNEFRAVELIMGALLEAGLDGKQAAVHYRMIGDVLNAISGLRAGYVLLPEEFRERDDSAWSREYRMVDSREFPNIAKLGRHLATIKNAQILQTLIDALILAVEAAAASSKGRR